MNCFGFVLFFCFPGGFRPLEKIYNGCFSKFFYSVVSWDLCAEGAAKKVHVVERLKLVVVTVCLDSCARFGVRTVMGYGV